jgi:hypothetical protein
MSASLPEGSPAAAAAASSNPDRALASGLARRADPLLGLGLAGARQRAGAQRHVGGLERQHDDRRATRPFDAAQLDALRTLLQPAQVAGDLPGDVVLARGAAAGGAAVGSSG